MDAGGDRPGTDGFEAGRWPDDADVIGLLVPPGAGPGACGFAAGAADGSAEDRRTLLANLAGAGPDLDGHLGATAEEGLFDAGRSGRSLRQIAVRPPGRSFLYLPAGRAGPPDDDGRAVRARLVGLMARVAERVRDEGGRLLLFLPDEGGWPEALPGLLDGVVLLEGASVPAAWGDRAPEVLGRRAPDEGGEEEAAGAGAAPAEEPAARPDRGPGPGPPTPDAAGGDAPPGADAETPVAGAGSAGDASDGEAGDDGGAPAGDGSEAPGGWRRHRRSSGLPWARIALGTAAVVALAAGWWWLVRETGPGPGDGGDAAAVEVAADSVPAGADGAGPGADGAGADEEAGREAPAETGGDAGALDAAPELPYSVLIASYAEWPQARRRLEAWRDPSGPVYFVAPTRVRGGLYWRLFAGALPDRASGEALMEELVEEGRKDRARTWDVRPVELAFLAGTAGSRSEARSRVRELEERGLPAYTLPAARGPDTTWAVWAGGFESGEEASDLRALLREAEIEAELVTRRGETETR